MVENAVRTGQIELVSAPWAGRDARRLAAVYEEAFPAHERPDMRVIRAGSLRPDAQFLVARNNEGELIGFAYTSPRSSAVYVLFLAVARQYRSRGYGTALIAALRTYYHGRGLVLAIESVSVRYDDYEQRVRRKNFYERNGFIDSGWRVYERSGIYDLYTSQAEVDIKHYKRAMRIVEPLSRPIRSVRVTP